MRPPRVFAPEADSEHPRVELPEDEAHHLTRVLRLTAGAEVVLFDGRGAEWHARLAPAAAKRHVVAEIVAEALPAAEPPVVVTLGVGLLKGDQMDAVVYDATLLGAAAIVPLSTAHVAVPKQGRSSTVLSRWRRVAIAAAKQSGRSVVPTILPLTPFSELLAQPEFVVKLMCVEPSVSLSSSTYAQKRFVPRPDLPPPDSVLLLVGPEGGWSPIEVAQFAANDNARFLQLGPLTLRAESTPIVALTTLWSVWGW